MASKLKLRKIARKYAKRAGVDPDVFDRQINLESGYNTKARSPAGALGIAQFMPGTARSRGVNPLNPRQALKGAAKLDADLIHQLGYRRGLAAYNAGPGNIKAGLGYADRLLAGKNPKTPGKATAQDSGPSSVTASKTVPGVDRSSQRRALISQYFQTQPKASSSDPYGVRQQGSLLTLQAGLKQTQDTPAKTVTATATVPGSTDSGGGGSTRDLLSRAVAQSKTRQPYRWGGGHGSKPAAIGTPVDCSGYVSQILGVSPRVSGQFAKFGDAGPGKRVTIYANSGHVLIQIGGRWFATSRSNPGGGAGEIARPSDSYLARFTPRHPRGM